MKRIPHSYLIFPLLLASCSTSLFETRDPAVRIATCISTAATSLFYNDEKKNLEVDCDTKLSGEYLVILYPAKDYSNNELIEKGLSVDTIRKLRLRGPPVSPRGRINVIPLFTTHAGTKSTAYGPYVSIIEWQQVKKNTNIVSVELKKLDTNSIIIANIK